MASAKVSVVWSEIDSRFVADGQGRLKVVENVAAVESGIESILKTRKGERCMLPEFGSDLPNIVFEPINSTAVKMLSRVLKDDIEKWDNRAVVEGVELYPNPDQGSLSVYVYYRIRGFEEVFKFETTVQGG